LEAATITAIRHLAPVTMIWTTKYTCVCF
jgi:hypothetical protein